MTIKSLSYDQVKDLYLQKIQAIKNKDHAYLQYLKRAYPELFDKRFLYHILQTELKIHSQDLPPELEKALQAVIKQKETVH